MRLARAGVSLAVITAIGALLGAVIELPLPFTTDTAASEAALGPILNARTASGLGPGPIHPVLGRFEYGQGDARFHAARSGHVHEGQDIFAPPGTALVAARPGVVVDGGPAWSPMNGGRGNYLAIYNGADRRSYVYMHMQKPPRERIGDHLSAGQLVGRLGCTGSCYGPHLHFEIRIGRAAPGSETKAIDPLPALRRWRPLASGSRGVNPVAGNR
jgi:murein DD-endopeptidase MepM/ murein hydrolase activator NlpD